MKIKIQGTEEELLHKSDSLVKSISKLIDKVDPELSDSLLKALPTKDDLFTEPVQLELLKQWEMSYREQLSLMLNDIGKVLEGKSVFKSLDAIIPVKDGLMSKKEKLFSISIHDCRVDVYKGSGAGGQKRNKTSNAVRVVHEPSGAVGQSEEQRSQSQNKKTAFLRMAETHEFQKWVRMEAARLTGETARVRQKVEKEMKNVKAEIKDERGRWIEWQD